MPLLLLLLAILLGPGCHGQDPPPTHQPTQTPTQSPAPRFVDVTESVGINFLHQNSRTPRKHLVESMGSGCAFLDADGDGWLDVLLLNNKKIPGGSVKRPTTLKLYHNERGKLFRDVTKQAGLDVELFAMG